jgi:hypothetical protein
VHSAATTTTAHADPWAAVVLVGILVAMVALSLWWMYRADRPDDDSGEGGGGSRKHPPEPPSPLDGPAWWAEFERELADYVAAGAQSPSLPRSRSYSSSLTTPRSCSSLRD